VGGGVGAGVGVGVGGGPPLHIFESESPQHMHGQRPRTNVPIPMLVAVPLKVHEDSNIGDAQRACASSPRPHSSPAAGDAVATRQSAASHAHLVAESNAAENTILRNFTSWKSSRGAIDPSLNMLHVHSTSSNPTCRVGERTQMEVSSHAEKFESQQ
jgi:hypothetical protein